MSEFQRVVKYCAMAFAAFLAVAIIGGIATGLFALTSVFSATGSGKTIDVTKSFENVKSLTIDHGVGNLYIKTGETEKVEVIAKGVSDNFSLEQNFSGNLNIRTKFNFFNWINGSKQNKSSNLTIYLPKNFLAENFKIQAGTGNVDIESLNSKKLYIDAGTGNIKGENIIASDVELNGGVGEIELRDVELTDVDIDSGVGNIDVQGKILGKNVINCGVGNVDLRIIGTTDDYNIKVDKGLGSLYVNGEKYSDLEWNNFTAPNSLDIDGGVGDIDIVFE